MSALGWIAVPPNSKAYVLVRKDSLPWHSSHTFPSEVHPIDIVRSSREQEGQAHCKNWSFLGHAVNGENGWLNSKAWHSFGENGKKNFFGADLICNGGYFTWPCLLFPSKNGMPNRPKNAFVEESCLYSISLISGKHLSPNSQPIQVSCNISISQLLRCREWFCPCADKGKKEAIREMCVV